MKRMISTQNVIIDVVDVVVDRVDVSVQFSRDGRSDRQPEGQTLSGRRQESFRKYSKRHCRVRIW